MIGKRLPQIAFAVLALATIGAFFLIQALKTSNPLLWPPLRSIPAAINPLAGQVCKSGNNKHTPINYGETRLTLAIPRADSVGVYMVNASDANGPTVATLSSGTEMKAAPGPGKDSKVFTWNGDLQTGPWRRAARITSGSSSTVKANRSTSNIRSGRSSRPILGAERPAGRHGSCGPAPRPTAPRPTGTTTTGTTTTGANTTPTGTTVAGGGAATTPSGPAVLSPPNGSVKIDFTRGRYRRVWITLSHRSPASRVGTPPLTVHNLQAQLDILNGKIDGQPAPAGTYLVGITAEDRACNSPLALGGGLPLTPLPVPGSRSAT